MEESNKQGAVQQAPIQAESARTLSAGSQEKPPWPRPDYVERANRRADLHTHGFKGMFVLNGGGALALLTFLTQVVQNQSDAQIIVRYTTLGIAFLVGGLIFLAPINHLRYESSRLFDHDATKPKGKKYGTAHRILFFLSLLFFVLGVSIALRGIWLWKA